MTRPPLPTLLLCIVGLVGLRPSPGMAEPLESLATLEKQFLASFQTKIEDGHQRRVTELDASYLAAIEKSLQTETRAGRLEEAIALRNEIARVKSKAPLPADDSDTKPSLIKLRATYREELAKLLTARAQAAAPLVAKFEEVLASLQSTLTKAGKLDDAAAVKSYRESGTAAQLLRQEVSLESLKKRAAPDTALLTASKDKPYANSLGMKFLPVKGTRVLFCIHETRRKDYAAFAQDVPGIPANWQNKTYASFTLPELCDDYAAAAISWTQAKKFCEWLSQKEGKTYRLPTDEEWSWAMGVARKEKRSSQDTPATIPAVAGDFAWGNAWPPPLKSGNFSDASRRAKAPDQNGRYLENYDDGYPTVAPVMSFAPNSSGIYDLSGNVWEWCEDWWNAAQAEHPLRGGSWTDAGQFFLSSSSRSHGPPDIQAGAYGFRVVLIPDIAP